MRLAHPRLSSLFLTSLPLFSLLSSPLGVEARHHDGLVKQRIHRPVHTAIAQRQWKPNRFKRHLIDVCIDLSAVVELGVVLDSDVELCLCVQDLNIFLDSHVGLESEALDARALVTLLLNPIFEATPPCRPLPLNAHRVCKTTNPCNFVCDTGYSLDPVTQQCVCVGTNCATPSPVPRPLKARSNPSEPVEIDVDDLCTEVDLGPELDTVSNELLDTGDLIHPGRCSRLLVPPPSEVTPSVTSLAPTSVNPSSSISAPTTSSSSCLSPSSPPPTVDGLLALLYEILVQYGTQIQGSSLDLGVTCECKDAPSDGDPSSSLSTSLKVVVDLSTELGNSLGSLETNLKSIDTLIILTNRLIDAINNCLGWQNLNVAVAASLNQTLAVTQSLLDSLKSLNTGLGLCGCTLELAESLLKGLHLSKRSSVCSSSNPGITAIGVTASDLDSSVNFDNSVDKTVTDSLCLEPIAHPTRAYPIRRDLLSSSRISTPDCVDPPTPTSTSLAVEIETKPLVNSKLDLKTTLNGLVVGVTHNLGLGPDQTSPAPSSTIDNQPVALEGLFELCTEIQDLGLDLHNVLYNIGLSCGCHDSSSGPASSTDLKVLFKSILDLGADINTTIGDLNVDLNLISQLIVQLGQLNSTLTSYFALSTQDTNLSSQINHVSVNTERLLQASDLLQTRLDDCGCVETLLQSLQVGSKVSKHNRFFLF